MKNLFVLVLVFLCFSFTAQAQTSFGVGGAIGLERGGIDDDGGEKLGIGIHGRALLSDVVNNIDVGIGATYWLTSAPDPSSVTYFEISGNAHYALTDNDDAMNFYALGGLNIGYVDVDVDTGIPGLDVGGSDTEIGLNLGAGLRTGNIYAEAMYATNWEDISVTAGIYF